MADKCSSLHKKYKEVSWTDLNPDTFSCWAHSSSVIISFCAFPFPVYLLLLKLISSIAKEIFFITHDIIKMCATEILFFDNYI